MNAGREQITWKKCTRTRHAKKNSFTRAANFGVELIIVLVSVNLVQIWAKWEKLITDQTRKRSKLWKIWLTSYEFIASSPRIRLALGKCMQNSGWLSKHCRLLFKPVFLLDFSLQASNFMLFNRRNNVGSVFPHNALQRWVLQSAGNLINLHGAVLCYLRVWPRYCCIFVHVSSRHNLHQL